MTQKTLPYTLAGDVYHVDMPHPRFRSPAMDERITVIQTIINDPNGYEEYNQPPTFPHEPGWYDVLCCWELKVAGEAGDPLNWVPRHDHRNWWSATTDADAQAIEQQAMVNWVGQYGSSHLKTSFERGYFSRKQYLAERLQHEYPHAILDLKSAIAKKVSPVSQPSERALSLETSLQTTYNIRTVWLSTHKARTIDGYQLAEGEYVFLSGWLGGYDVFIPVGQRERASAPDEDSRLPYKAVTKGSLTVVAGLAHGVGTSEAAMSLAATLVRLGQRTLLIDGGSNTKYGRIRQMRTHPNRRMKTDRDDLKALTTQLTADSDVDVIECGNMFDHDRSSATRSLVAYAVGEYDHVVVDAGTQTPAELPFVDRMVVINRADNQSAQHLAEYAYSALDIPREVFPYTFGGSQTTVDVNGHEVTINALPAAHNKALKAINDNQLLIDAIDDYKIALHQLAVAFAGESIAAEQSNEDAHGKIICFTSPKGGVGKSTMAANTAYLYAQEHPDRKVLLMDGDVANGNLALRIAQRLEPNLLDMLNHMDGQMSKGEDPLMNYNADIGPYVLGHPSRSNLDVLAAPDNPEVLEQIQHNDLTRLFRAFASHYDLVVIDTGTQLIEHTNAFWLSVSSHVYAMVEPEIACLHATAAYLKRARQFQLLMPENVRLVMIRADLGYTGLDPKKVAADVFSFIRPDRQYFIDDIQRAAIDAGNAAAFVVDTLPSFNRQLMDIIRDIDTPIDAAKPKSSWKPRRRGQ